MFLLAAAESITLAAPGWSTIDLTGAPYSVPAGATFAVVRVNQLGSSIVEFRKPGSSYSPVTTTNSHGTMSDAVVPLAAGSIDVYSSVATGASLELHLVGYLSSTEGVSFTEPVEVAGAVTLDDTWHTVDASAYIPSSAKWAVVQVCTNIPAHGTDDDTRSGIIRVRKYGVTTPGMTGTYPCDKKRTNWFLVPVDSLGRFDTIAYDWNTGGPYWRKLYLLGYVTAGSHNDTPTVSASSAGVAAWNPETDPSAHYASVLELHRDGIITSGATTNYGWRGGGSTDTLLSVSTSTTNHKSDSITTTAIAAQDASDQFEVYFYTTAAVSNTSRWFTHGWLDVGTHEIDESLAATDAVAQDLYTRDVEESAAATDSVVAGDTYDDSVAESATATDAVSEEHSRGAVALESLAATDAASGEIASNVIGHMPIAFASFSAELLVGYGYTAGTIEDPVETIVLFGDPLNYVYTAGDITDPVETLVLSGLFLGMVGTPGTILDPVETLSVVGLGAYIATSFSLTDPVETLLVAVANGVDATDQEFILFALNTINGAVTRLPYAVNSMCELDGIVYTAGPDGIMIFEGSNTNNGAAINARISKNGLNFGTSKLKVITDFFMRCRTQGSMKVTSSSNQVSDSVTTADEIDVLHGFKSNLARGVKGSELGIAIENVDGCDFEIPEFEFLVNVSASRRGRH